MTNIDKPELETLDYKPPKCVLPNDNGGVLANPEQPRNGIDLAALNIKLVPNNRGGHKLVAPITEQPNKELMIIKTIQGLITVINDNLEKLTDPKATQYTKIAWNEKLSLRAKAIEEIDLFEKTTLYELQKAYE